MGGIILHTILTVPIFLFLKGKNDSMSKVLAQVLNPFILMLILWRGEKRRGAVPLSKPASR